MANVLAELFQNTANAIREKTGEEGSMKPAEFPEKIRSIQTGGTGGTGNAEADVRPLTVTENGTYYPTENTEIGKTYTFKESYTQTELQTLFHASANKFESQANLFIAGTRGAAVSTDGTVYALGFMSEDDGMYIWAPEELVATGMVAEMGWHVYDETNDSYTKLETAPSITLAEDSFTLYLNDISELNPLFVLREYDGFSEVTVNVPETVPELEEITITENGTYTPSETDGYSKITVNVPTESANGGNSGGGGTNGEANLISLTATKNGVYYPGENVEIGKTYTLRNDYTQEELQALYGISGGTSEDGVYAWLCDIEDVGTIGIMHDYGMYGVYISDGHIWLPAEIAEQMGFTTGWNFGSDLTDLTPTDIPTVELVEGDVVIYTEKLTDLNPLFELKEYDGFSHVEVQVTNSEGRSVKVAEGTYTPTSETEIITINHNLGFVPDMIIIRGIGKPTAIMQLTSGTFFSPTMVQPSDITAYYHVCQNLNTGGFTLGSGKADFRENNGYNSYVNNVNGISFDVGSSGFVQHMPGAKYTWTAFGNMLT
ncbi:MAG: hypothetical protein E7603_10565 [Ruminococcaceae bacterium]|nr:hypothetical protein [Oscillospiraceae bacterium]